MQRCRELFAAAVHGVDHLVYDPEGDRLLLRGEEVTGKSSSVEESSGEDEGDVEQGRNGSCIVTQVGV